MKLRLFQLIFILTALMAATASKKAKSKKKKIRDRQRELQEFVREDEGHLVEPYLGGYNSQKSAILLVQFHDFAKIQTEINPRWRAFREMVEDMQKMLLTGGVKTNIFRDKKPGSGNNIVCVLNDGSQLDEARDFFELQAEVVGTALTDDNPNAELTYGADEL